VESKAGGRGIWKNPAQLSKNAVLAAAERTGEVQRLLRDLFGKVRHQCICEESHCALNSGAKRLSGDPAPPCQSREMPSLPSVRGSAHRVVPLMSGHQKATLESIAVLLSSYCQDLSTFQGPSSDVSQ